MIHFPESFPSDTLAVLGPILRTGEIADGVLAGEALWNLQGYALFLTLGHEHAGASFLPRQEVTKEQAEAALAELESSRDGAAAKFNLKKFAENALKLVEFILPLVVKA